MKQMIIVWALICCAAISSHAQAIDTVITADYGKMPPVYFSNKIYWERNYDNKNHLLFEALKYNSCFIGAFADYWENGRVKTCGQYLHNHSGNWASLQAQGLCSVRDGEWISFNSAGRLINTTLYEKGKVIKEY